MQAPSAALEEFYGVAYELLTDGMMKVSLLHGLPALWSAQVASEEFTADQRSVTGLELGKELLGASVDALFEDKWIGLCATMPKSKDDKRTRDCAAHFSFTAHPRAEGSGDGETCLTLESKLRSKGSAYDLRAVVTLLEMLKGGGDLAHRENPICRAIRPLSVSIMLFDPSRSMLD